MERKQVGDDLAVGGDPLERLTQDPLAVLGGRKVLVKVKEQD